MQKSDTVCLALIAADTSVQIAGQFPDKKRVATHSAPCNTASGNGCQNEIIKPGGRTDMEVISASAG